MADGYMTDTWRIHGGYMADTRIHGGWIHDGYTWRDLALTHTWRDLALTHTWRDLAL